MCNYYVYILKCADASYCTGVTNDPERRVIEHNSGKDMGSYTFKRRPVEMVFCEMHQNINDAIAFEKQVKGWSRKKKEAIIASEWHRLPELSKNRSTKELSHDAD